MSETQADPGLSGKMYLYDKPELINPEQHADLGFQRIDKPFGFCAKARALPLTISEVPAAMKDYPVIFVSKDQLVPMAVVGLIDDVNLFVDENGNWEKNRYIPGYARRYPFGVASETGGSRIAIVIDTAFEGLAKGGEKPLFAGGEPSDATKQAIDFCTNYERDRLMTENYARELAKYDLVQGQSAQFTPTGSAEPQTFAEYFGIDETRLKALTDEQIVAMNKVGLLPVVYAMMMSLGNWRTLLQRRAERFGISEAEALTRKIN